ncbi:hypothetical protein TRM7615_02521 [Falsiruegeria mediterranea M17]|uniref:Uncharacterized protein n=1 Tax=Falsiruegeria mediterranea M17 TaxID=1200281 RepID=A0A2R8C992_9RHOB|nr:hypothetical protein TRM7615_02521 [Falsiruegeria mediterranea M17]
MVIFLLGNFIHSGDNLKSHLSIDMWGKHLSLTCRN